MFFWTFQPLPLIRADDPNADSDGDGLPDWWETLYGMNLNDPTDAFKDRDGDRIPNAWEYLRGTDPTNASDAAAPDVVVDGSQPTDASVGRYATLQEGYDALPVYEADGLTPHYGFIEVKKGTYTAGVDGSQAPKKVFWQADVGGQVVLQISGPAMVIADEAVVDGFTIQGDGQAPGVGVVVQPPSGAVPEVRVVNTIIAGRTDSSAAGGILNNGGNLWLVQDTLVSNLGTSADAVLNESGTVHLVNSIVGGQGSGNAAQSVVDQTNGGVTAQNSIITGMEGAWGSSDADPHLTDTGGHLTAASTTCFAQGATDAGAVVDLYGQARLSGGSSPDLGAEQWVDSLGNGLPDWYEQRIVDAGLAGSFSEILPGSDYQGDGRSAAQDFQMGLMPYHHAYRLVIAADSSSLTPGETTNVSFRLVDGGSGTDLPLESRSITFGVISGDGNLSASYGSTDSNGICTAVFTGGTGATQISAADQAFLGISQTFDFGVNGGASPNYAISMWVDASPAPGQWTYLHAQMTDAGTGIPVSGATIDFSVVSGDGTVYPISSATDSSGNCVVTFTAGSSSSQVNAWDAGGSGASSSCTIDVGGESYTLYVWADGNQSTLSPGQSCYLYAQLIETVSNSAVSGALISFNTEFGDGTLGSASTMTDGNGIATVTFTGGYSRTQVDMADQNGYGTSNSYTFGVTDTGGGGDGGGGDPPPPDSYSLTMSADANPLTQGAQTNLHAVLMDTTQNTTIAGVTVNFSLVSGDGSLSSYYATTDDYGSATVGFTGGANPSEINAADAAGYGTGTTFTVGYDGGNAGGDGGDTGGGGAHSYYLSLSANKSTLAPGESTTFHARVVDETGAGTPGVSLYMSVTSGDGSLNVPGSSTDGSGYLDATFTGGTSTSGIAVSDNNGYNFSGYYTFGVVTDGGSDSYTMSMWADPNPVVQGGNATLYAQLMDATTHTPVSNAVINFNIMSGDGYLTNLNGAGSPTTDGNGVAVMVFTGGSSSTQVSAAPSDSLYNVSASYTFNVDTSGGGPGLLLNIWAEQNPLHAGNSTTLHGTLVDPVTEMGAAGATVHFAIGWGNGVLEHNSLVTDAGGNFSMGFTGGTGATTINASTVNGAASSCTVGVAADPPPDVYDMTLWSDQIVLVPGAATTLHARLVNMTSNTPVSSANIHFVKQFGTGYLGDGTPASAYATTDSSGLCAITFTGGTSTTQINASDSNGHGSRNWSFFVTAGGADTYSVRLIADVNPLSQGQSTYLRAQVTNLSTHRTVSGATVTFAIEPGTGDGALVANSAVTGSNGICQVGFVGGLHPTQVNAQCALGGNGGAASSYTFGVPGTPHPGDPVFPDADPWSAGGGGSGSGLDKTFTESFYIKYPDGSDNVPTYHTEAYSLQTDIAYHTDQNGNIVYDENNLPTETNWHPATSQTGWYNYYSIEQEPVYYEIPAQTCADCDASGGSCDATSCVCTMDGGTCMCHPSLSGSYTPISVDNHWLDGKMRILFDAPVPFTVATRWKWTYTNNVTGEVSEDSRDIYVAKGATEINEDDLPEASTFDNNTTVLLQFDGIDNGGGGGGSNAQPSFSGSFSDSAGPKFRKIGMDGKPMRDAFPDPQDEYKQPQSVTAVDGLTGQLRLDMTDAQVRRAPGTHIALAARRDYAEETWSDSSGVRFPERPDRPFGAGFTSNICASLTLEKVSYTSEPNPSDPASVLHRQRYTVTLVDDQGCVQRFKAVNKNWVRIKEERSDVVTANNVLTSVWDNQGNPFEFVLTKGLGGSCVYDMTTMKQSFPTSRDLGDGLHLGKGNLVEVTYGRLNTATDRRGQCLTYTYGSDCSLIATSISESVGGGSLNISIGSDGLVQSVSSSNDSATTFAYQAVTGTNMALASSTKDGLTYTYSFALRDEEDPTPIPPDPNDQNPRPPDVFHHIYLTGVTEPGEKAYAFTSDLDHNHSYEQSYYQDDSLQLIWRVQLGMPQKVSLVTGPGGMSANINASYASSVDIYGDFSADAGTNVGGSAGDFSFSFGGFRSEIVPSDADDIEDLNYSKTVTGCFTSMGIDSAAGGMSFEFNYDLGMPLTSFTDINGHTTNWTYSLGDEYPSSQTNPLNGTRNFVYDQNQDLAYLVDERGGMKEYVRDQTSGLPLWVNVYAPDGTPVFQRQVGYETTPGRTTYANLEVIRALHPELGEQDLVMTVERDDRGNVTKEVQDPGGLNLQTLHDYSERDLLTRTVDPLGNTTRYKYNLRGECTLTQWPGDATHPDGPTHQWAYDDRGNLISETDEMGTVTDYTYDDLDQKLSATVHLDPEHPQDPERLLVHQWTYTDNHEVLTETDPNGNVTTHGYDGAGWRNSSTLDNEMTQYAYGLNSARTIWDDPKPTVVTDPRGVQATHVYDALRREISSTITDGVMVGVTTSTQYDDVGNPVSVTDPLGRVTNTQFDAMDRPVLVAFADGLQRYTDYDSQGKVIHLTDELNRETWTTYDDAGRPVQVMAPAVLGPDNTMVHPIVTTSYDPASRPVTVTDALGNATDTEFDTRGRPTKVTSPTAWDAATQTMRRAEVSTEYDALGRVTKVTDAYGQVTSKVYDRASRLLETHLPPVSVNGGAAQATVLRSEYDKNGNVTLAVDAAGHETVNEYDAHNRLTKTTDAENQITQFGYDLSGNRSSVTDAKGNITHWTYDGMKRVLTETGANGVVLVTNTYDAVNKTKNVDALGRAITYDYDLRNRLQHMKEIAPGHALTDPANTRTYAYDNGGRLLSVSESADATASVAYTYDDLDHVLSETSRGLTHQYSYDLGGNRVGASYATGRQVTTSYDALNRPEQTVDGTRVTEWVYDVGGRCVTQQEANGTVVHNSYDAQGRLTDRSQTYGASTRTTFSWQHDKLGNVTQQEENFGSGARITQMAYDNTSRLLVETVTAGSDVDESTYTYDPASNRSSLVKTHNGSTQTNTTYTYNNLNQLTGWTEKNGSGATLRDAALHYDAVGNRSSQTITPASGSEQDTTYGWDTLNRLTSVSLPSGQTHQYAYDYRTRRIARTEAGSSTALSFSGGLSAAEYSVTNPQSAIPNPQSTSVEFQRGPDLGGGVGGLLYSLRGGTAKFNLSNARGDVVAQTDSSGGLTWQASYEAYGKRPVETGANADRQRANSKEEDPTGLLNEGFRYRDLETGVWLSRDPAGFVDGPNLYAYVQQNPWSKFDPEGLYSFREFGNDFCDWGSGVGRMWKGYGETAVDLVAAPIHAVAHPINTVTGLAHAVAHPINTTKAVANSIATDWNSGEEGQGKVVGGVLLTIGTAGAGYASKAGQVANIANKIDKAAEVANTGSKAADAIEAGSSAAKTAAKTEQTISKEAAAAGPKCFAAGTKVETRDGGKKIEDIKPGELVLAFDFDTKRVVERRVLERVSNFTYFWADVEIGDDVLHATRGHKFWVESEQMWIDAASLEPGMRVRLSDGKICEVGNVTVRELKAPETTFNLIVDRDHNYFVGTHHILVHNGYPESPQYPPPTKIGETFQFNFDTSKDYKKSRRAGVERARAAGLIPPADIGHHTNSVQTHPHLAAEPSNISPESTTGSHLETHDGNWRNPTTGPLNAACP